MILSVTSLQWNVWSSNRCLQTYEFISWLGVEYDTHAIKGYLADTADMLQLMIFLILNNGLHMLPAMTT